MAVGSGSPTISSPWIPRSLILLVLGSSVATPHLYQPALDYIYTSLRHSSFFTASTFETWWTVIIYAIIEVSYTYRFAHNPQLRLANQKKDDTIASKPIPKMQRPKHRLVEGLTYIFPLLILDLTLIKKYAGVSVQDIATSGNYDLASVKKTIHGTFLAPTLHNFTLSSPLQTRRALPLAPPTSRELVLQLLTSLFIYDSLFFFFHLTLHHPIFASIHSQHHNHKEINPQITNQLDIVERLGLVLLANFSLNIIAKPLFIDDSDAPLASSQSPSVEDTSITSSISTIINPNHALQPRLFGIEFLFADALVAAIVIPPVYLGGRKLLHLAMTHFVERLHSEFQLQPFDTLRVGIGRLQFEFGCRTHPVTELADKYFRNRMWMLETGGWGMFWGREWWGSKAVGTRECYVSVRVVGFDEEGRAG
ncbi:MAG: hypothetical protein Q9169_008301 [Polycauliona sp. 2 TL-2023]